MTFYGKSNSGRHRTALVGRKTLVWQRGGRIAFSLLIDCEQDEQESNGADL